MGQVTLKNIQKNYGDTPVIKGIDLEVHEGEFMVFVGPSGCGKSTTLRMIAGLESISGGDLLIDGVRANDLHPVDRGAAMVFQSYALYPHMSVRDNMGFALKMAGQKKAAIATQVNHSAEILRITDLLDRLPKDLSGGQRQRVAIGRAIVRKPKVFLFDEPLSNLDAALRVNMRIELSRLHKELGTTMIYVTHDQVEAMTMGNRIAVFNKGHVEQVGAPLDLYNQPQNEFVAGFLGAPRINFVARPPAQNPSPTHQRLWDTLIDQHPQRLERAKRCAICPEHLTVTAADQGIPATVVLAEHLGDTSVLHLRVDGIDDLINAKLGAHHGMPIGAGQAIGLQPDTSWSLAFDAAGQLI